MHVIVTLILDRPFPDLSRLLPFFRERAGLVRFLHLSVERSPRQLVAALQRSTPLCAPLYHLFYQISPLSLSHVLIVVFRDSVGISQDPFRLC